MFSPLVLSLLFLCGGASEDPWRQIRLSIARDPYTSSDHVTLCRVTAVNSGGRRIQGRSLLFEARATTSGSTVRERGRFGLELAPYGTLETLIALPGRHDRVEVSPIREKEGGAGAARSPKKRKRSRP
jgi:hypothetical protein